MPGYYTEVGAASRARRGELGINVPLLGGDGWDSPETRQDRRRGVDGCYFTNHYSRRRARARGAEVRRRLQGEVRRQGARRDGDRSATTPMTMMADAIKRAGTTEAQGDPRRAGRDQGLPRRHRHDHDRREPQRPEADRRAEDRDVRVSLEQSARSFAAPAIACAHASMDVTPSSSSSSTACRCGAIYALIALGYTMVYGVLRLINFAHGDVFMIGAFVGYYVGAAGSASSRRGTPALRPACSRCRAGRVDGRRAALLGSLIERLAYRPLRNAAAHDAADHRDRRLAPAANPAASSSSGPTRSSSRCCIERAALDVQRRRRRAHQHRRCSIFGVTLVLMLALQLHRAATRRSAWRMRAVSFNFDDRDADGHQRQPRDLASRSCSARRWPPSAGILFGLAIRRSSR